jgi:hypothetical protein
LDSSLLYGSRLRGGSHFGEHDVVPDDREYQKAEEYDLRSRYYMRGVLLELIDVNTGDEEESPYEDESGGVECEEYPEPDH